LYRAYGTRIDAYADYNQHAYAEHHGHAYADIHRDRHGNIYTHPHCNAYGECLDDTDQYQNCN
jgi:hypothetical protein